MSNTLIDMDVLAKRVETLLPDVRLHHHSMPEIIKMLCDELDEVKQYAEHIESGLMKMDERLDELESGKPSWMRESRD